MRIVGVKLRSLDQLARVRRVNRTRVIHRIDAAGGFVAPKMQYLLDFAPQSQARVDEMIETIATYVPNWQTEISMIARYRVIGGLDIRIDRELVGVVIGFRRITDLCAIILHSMEDTTVVREPERLLVA